MRRLFLIVLVSLLFIGIACKKIEENPTYKIELKSSIFNKNSTKVWRDTLFYSISGATEENYRFALKQINAESSNSSSIYSNSYDDENIKIVDQNPNYLVYEINPKSTYYSSKEYTDVMIFLIANGEIIDDVVLPIKYVTNTSNSTGDDGWLIYKYGSSTIKKYDFNLLLHSTVYSAPSSIYKLKLSPSANHFAYSRYSSIFYHQINGVINNSESSTYADDIGFTTSNELFYIDGNYRYEYINIYSSTSKSSLYIYGLRDFVSAPNSYYYNINYSSSQYSIKQGNASTLYSSYSTLDDLTIDDQNTTLLFVESGTKLKKMNLSTRIVTTLYSVSNGKIKEPDFKGDGNKIAFVVENYSGYGDIYTINVDGTNVINLTNTSSIDEDLPNWK